MVDSGELRSRFPLSASLVIPSTMLQGSRIAVDDVAAVRHVSERERA